MKINKTANKRKHNQLYQSRINPKNFEFTKAYLTMLAIVASGIHRNNWIVNSVDYEKLPNPIYLIPPLLQFYIL